jgi:hypothetical protein
MNMTKAARTAALALAGYDTLMRPRMPGWVPAAGREGGFPPGWASSGRGGRVRGPGQGGRSPLPALARLRVNGFTGGG